MNLDIALFRLIENINNDFIKLYKYTRMYIMKYLIKSNLHFDFNTQMVLYSNGGKGYLNNRCHD